MYEGDKRSLELEDLFCRGRPSEWFSLGPLFLGTPASCPLRLSILAGKDPACLGGSFAVKLVTITSFLLGSVEILVTAGSTLVFTHVVCV